MDKSNSMIELCLQCITLCLKLDIFFIVERPEDLGATSRYGPNARPASIWQLLPIREWVKHRLSLSGDLAPTHRSPHVSCIMWPLCNISCGQECRIWTPWGAIWDPFRGYAIAVDAARGSSAGRLTTPLLPQLPQPIHLRWSTGWLPPSFTPF